MWAILSLNILFYIDMMNANQICWLKKPNPYFINNTKMLFQPYLCDDMPWENHQEPLCILLSWPMYWQNNPFPGKQFTMPCRSLFALNCKLSEFIILSDMDQKILIKATSPYGSTQRIQVKQSCTAHFTEFKAFQWALEEFNHMTWLQNVTI